MPFDARIHHRRSIRLPGYDYRNPGGYFVTIVTHAREPLFSDAVLRRVVETFWTQIPGGCPQMLVDEYVVMPNHLHGILVFTHTAASETAEPHETVHALKLTAESLGAIIGSFKSQTARRINQIRKTAGAPVWQRNYYEHIVRNERELAAIRQYIRDNPINWAEDPENPAL